MTERSLDIGLMLALRAQLFCNEAVSLWKRSKSGQRAWPSVPHPHNVLVSTVLHLRLATLN